VVGAQDPLPVDLAAAVRWLEQNTLSLIALTADDRPVLARRVLDRISSGFAQELVSRS
jgi:hypothetical protein